MDQRYADLILSHLCETYPKMLRPAGGPFKHPYLVPAADTRPPCGTGTCTSRLQAIVEIMEYAQPDAATRDTMMAAMKGCVLNLLNYQHETGAIPYFVDFGWEKRFAEDIAAHDEPNQAKPVLAQFARLISRKTGEVGWIRPRLGDLDRFLAHYDERYFHPATGLYFWRTGAVIGVDNDPCTFGRPRCSAGSLYLNCLMVREFEARGELFELGRRRGEGQPLPPQAGPAGRRLSSGTAGTGATGSSTRADLQCATQRDIPWLNHGLGVFWPCLPMRIRVWTGFMPMWAGLATPQQAEDLVALHLSDREALGRDYGIRSLAANEPMYERRGHQQPLQLAGAGVDGGQLHRLPRPGRLRLRARGRGVLRQGRPPARPDIERNGGMHEYYNGDTGEGVMNLGFMNWNYLAANMILKTRRMAGASPA